MNALRNPEPRPETVRLWSSFHPPVGGGYTLKDVDAFVSRIADFRNRCVINGSTLTLALNIVDCRRGTEYETATLADMRVSRRPADIADKIVLYPLYQTTGPHRVLKDRNA